MNSNDDGMLYYEQDKCNLEIIITKKQQDIPEIKRSNLTNRVHLLRQLTVPEI